MRKIPVFFLFVFFTICFSLFTFSLALEIGRIEITNQKNGLIRVSQDQGQTWKNVGKVLYPTDKVNKKGFTAGNWVGLGEVAAVSVNAIHIKTGEYNQRPGIFSLLPKEFAEKPRNYNSFLSPNSSITTDIPAGREIFGSSCAPLVSSQVLVNGKRFADEYVPKVGDIFTIIVDRPSAYPKEIIFENKFGGKVEEIWINGNRQVIGQVFKPVMGVGRFPGTLYASCGRIRANHPGVIDISTSPLGQVGGFQIIPFEHAESDEMVFSKTKTQWMVIGPVSFEGQRIAGSAPLFKYFIYPSFDEKSLSSPKWKEEFLSRFLVEYKEEKDKNWKPLKVRVVELDKELPLWAEDSFKNTTQFRILFPQ